MILRIMVMDEEARAAYDEHRLTVFPVEPVEVDGDLYPVCVLELEIVENEETVNERYIFYGKGGQWYLYQVLTTASQSEDELPGA